MPSLQSSSGLKQEARDSRRSSRYTTPDRDRKPTIAEGSASPSRSQSRAPYGSEDGAANGREDGEMEDEYEVEDEDADAMAQMLGFSGFSTSKVGQVCHELTAQRAGLLVASSRQLTRLWILQNQKRPNAEGAADIKKQRTWRQYMNRRGGFNRQV